MIDRAAYIEMTIRCLLLESEVQSLRARVGRHKRAAAQKEHVRYLREDERMTYPEIGERLGISSQAAQKRYMRMR